MTQNFEAIVEHGVLRPLSPVALPEGERVQVAVETRDRLGPEAVLDLAGKVYEGLSADDIAEIEQIALARGDMFGRNSH